MSFELGQRIKSVLNEYHRGGGAIFGTVVVVLRDGELKYLNEEVKSHEDMDYYTDGSFMDDENDVVVLFDDGHLEWGFDGDGDFTLLGE